jgi:hypothetical protein
VGDTNGGWFSGWHPDPVKREFAALEAMKVQLRVNLTDSEHECSHGRLPLDRNKPPECSCWTDAMTDALANRRQEDPDFSDAA